MEYRLIYDDEFSYFKIETSGDFCIDMFKRLTDELLSHPCWEPDVDCLFDYRSTSFLNTSLENFSTARDLHKKNDRKIGGGRSAIVMNGIGNFGFGRLYQKMAENAVAASFKIFKDIDEALIWLKAGDSEIPWRQLS